MNSEKENNRCVWIQRKNNPDLLKAGCTGQIVNFWKACRKRGLTPVQLFLSCPFCGKKVEVR